MTSRGKIDKFNRCTKCWHKATHSIGYFDEQTFYCNKHWEQAISTVRLGMKHIVYQSTPPKQEVDKGK